MMRGQPAEGRAGAERDRPSSGQTSRAASASTAASSHRSMNASSGRGPERRDASTTGSATGGEAHRGCGVVDRGGVGADRGRGACGGGRVLEHAGDVVGAGCVEGEPGGVGGPPGEQDLEGLRNAAARTGGSAAASASGTACDLVPEPQAGALVDEQTGREQVVEHGRQTSGQSPSSSGRSTRRPSRAILSSTARLSEASPATLPSTTSLAVGGTPSPGPTGSPR